MDHFFFTFADPDAYDDVSRWRCDPDDPRFQRTRKGLVSVRHVEGWAYDQHGIWTVCKPGGRPVTGQGWKLHVAVTPHTFAPLVRKVSEFCFEQGVPFKLLARHEYAWLVNAKYAPRQLSGKGLVLYPDSEEQSVELAGELAELLTDTDGPRILSDLRIGTSVVHARYGAYTRRYCRAPDGRISFALEAPDGRLMPDARAVPFSAPDFITVPEAFRPPKPPSDQAVPPYRVDKTLHFSNSGGVYLATHLDTGREVVLKEARPFAGYDLVGCEAIERAAAEYASMRRFGTLPEITEVYEQFTWQSHVFTAMEYVKGTTLIEWVAARHPFLLRSDPFAPPTPADVREYRDSIEHILAQVRGVLREIWDKDYIFGDIHPGNVMVGPELDVKLLDLEACVPQDADRPFPGAPGFSDPARSGREADEYALCLLELSCYLPLTHLVRLDDTKLDQLVDTARGRFGLSHEWAAHVKRTCVPTGAQRAATVRTTTASSHLDEGLGFAAWAAQIVTGLRATMDENRSDRLFRGDHSGFSLSPVCMSTGAAGVLWSLLDTTGLQAESLVDRVVDWIAVHGRQSAKRLESGLYDSELGAAYVLSKAGCREHAAWLMDASLAKDRDRSGLSLFSGLAGSYLAVREMAEGDAALLPASVPEEFGAELATRAADLLRRLRAAPKADVSQYGLLHGVAGVALAVHRYGTGAGDTSAIALARELLEFEFTGYIRCADGSLQFDEAGRRSLGYVEVGSCGAALVLAELSRHEGWTSSLASIPDLMRAMGPEMMVQSGLFRGRAGFMATLASLSRDGHGERADPLIDRHARQFGLHEIRPRPGELHFPGTRNYKLSSDLRTGSAGVLSSVAYATGRRTSWLPGVF